MSRCKQSEEPGALLSWFWREQHEWEAKNEKQKISDTENTADVFYGIKMKNTKPGTSNRNVCSSETEQRFNVWSDKSLKIWALWNKNIRREKQEHKNNNKRCPEMCWSHLANIQKYTDAASINQNHHA